MGSRYRTIGQAKKANRAKYRLKKGPNGRNLCRFCGTEVTPPRRTFCSGEKTKYTRRKIDGIWTKVVYRQGHGCVHSWCLRSSSSYARDAVFDRDQGVCAQCGKKSPRKGNGWAADHILACGLGGGLAGLENLQTLCRDCHHLKTKEDIKKIRSKKKKKMTSS